MNYLADRFFVILVLILCGTSAYFTIDISRIKKACKRRQQIFILHQDKKEQIKR